MSVDTIGAVEADKDADNLTPSAGVKRVLLHIGLWMISTPMILLSMSLLISISAFIVSFTLDQWHWFQRFGAVCVSLGAILSTRRMLRLGIQGMLTGENYFVVAQREKDRYLKTGDSETHCDLICSYWGFWVVGYGTLIWAFGDLVGYLL